MAAHRGRRSARHNEERRRTIHFAAEKLLVQMGKKLAMLQERERVTLIRIAAMDRIFRLIEKSAKYGPVDHAYKKQQEDQLRLLRSNLINTRESIRTTRLTLAADKSNMKR